MTEKLHYPDVFTRINIPKPERRLALKAKNLFDIVNGVEPGSQDIYQHLTDTNDTVNASQAFWRYDRDEDNSYDRLAMTIMNRGLTIAFQHRDVNNNTGPIRKSLIMENGISRVYAYDPIRARGGLENGSTAEQDIASFKQDYLETAARLGLYRHIQRIGAPQNESDAAIFAKAA